MFFVVSKLLSALTQPLSWVFLLMLAGLWRGRRQAARGRAMLWTGLLLILLLGWLPLPDLLLRRLEQAQPVPAAPGDPQWAAYAGVVVLGGALENAYVRDGNGQVALNGAAERMTMAIALARAHPRLKIVFTGGDGTLLRQTESEAAQARQYFREMGLADGQVLFESASRTTYENALYSAQLPGMDIHRPWLLLTSGWHMPRSLATFRKLGWTVTPYAVDYLAGRSTPWTQYAMVKSLSHWQIAVHETIGLWAYGLSGQAQ
ncbi:YdcF family protein [Xylophilus rhododendri]|uniref:YdcF family protein n=1 Tax=Xylophilus rhododendri TaxID=2697032 RepID=A0A857JAD4_9BURK|nr:YdcF family protein [Xylophilus rhododendri]QHJ00174.1 YdcF family protein [Xylophilus rhododendri]